jgi:uncharacterized membrane protein
VASRRVVEACLVFLVSASLVFILNVIFGDAMDDLQTQFGIILTHLTMSSGWNTQATIVLTNWHIFFNSFIIVIISIGFWVVKTIVIDMQYGTDNSGGGRGGY